MGQTQRALALAHCTKCVNVQRQDSELPKLKRLSMANTKEFHMLFSIILLVLFLLLLGVIPAWPHSRSWGYYPSGGLGLVLVILIFLMLAGRI